MGEYHPRIRAAYACERRRLGPARVGSLKRFATKVAPRRRALQPYLNQAHGVLAIRLNPASRVATRLRVNLKDANVYEHLCQKLGVEDIVVGTGAAGRSLGRVPVKDWTKKHPLLVVQPSARFATDACDVRPAAAPATLHPQRQRKLREEYSTLARRIGKAVAIDVGPCMTVKELKAYAQNTREHEAAVRLVLPEASNENVALLAEGVRDALHNNRRTFTRIKKLQERDTANRAAAIKASYGVADSERWSDEEDDEFEDEVLVQARAQYRAQRQALEAARTRPLNDAERDELEHEQQLVEKLVAGHLDSAACSVLRARLVAEAERVNAPIGCGVCGGKKKAAAAAPAVPASMDEAESDSEEEEMEEMEEDEPYEDGGYEDALMPASRYVGCHLDERDADMDLDMDDEYESDEGESDEGESDEGESDEESFLAAMPGLDYVPPAYADTDIDATIPGLEYVPPTYVDADLDDMSDEETSESEDSSSVAFAAKTVKRGDTLPFVPADVAMSTPLGATSPASSALPPKPELEVVPETEEARTPAATAHVRPARPRTVRFHGIKKGTDVDTDVPALVRTEVKPRRPRTVVVEDSPRREAAATPVAEKLACASEAQLAEHLVGHSAHYELYKKLRETDGGAALQDAEVVYLQPLEDFGSYTLRQLTGSRAHVKDHVKAAAALMRRPVDLTEYTPVVRYAAPAVGRPVEFVLCPARVADE